MNKINFILKIIILFLIANFVFAKSNKDSLYYFNGDKVQKQQASSGVVSTIVDYEKQSPTSNTLSPRQISACKLEARPFELGDGSQTNEWLVSTPPDCSVNRIATHWIVRNVNNRLHVLASGRGRTVSIFNLNTYTPPSKGLNILFSMRTPLPKDISSEVIKSTKMECTHSLRWSISENPKPNLNNDIATVSVVDGSIDPSIHGYVGQLPEDAAKHSLSIKRQMLSNKSFRCSDYY